MTSYGQMTNHHHIHPIRLVDLSPPCSLSTKPHQEIENRRSVENLSSADSAGFSRFFTGANLPFRFRWCSGDGWLWPNLRYVAFSFFLLFRMCIPPIAVQSGSLHRQWGNVLWQFYFYEKKGNFVPFLIRGSLWDYGWNLWAEFCRYLCRFLRCFYAY